MTEGFRAVEMGIACRNAHGSAPAPGECGAPHDGRRCRIRSVPLFLLTLSVLACGGGDVGGGPAGEAFTERDSAGVQIVESTAPLWGAGEGWRVDPVPVLQIGEFEGEEPYLFGGLFTASRFPDGRIVVFETASHTLRTYGPQGRHIATFGGKGDGPGEFATYARITLLAPDTVVAWDARSRRYSWYRADGTFVRGASLPPLVGENEEIGRSRSWTGWALLNDGTLFTADQASGRDTLADGSVVSEFQFGFIWNEGGDSMLIGRFPSRRSLGVLHDGRRVSVSDRFHARTQIAWQRDPPALHVSGSGPWEVLRYAPGRGLDRIVRAGIPRIAVTEELTAQVRDSMTAAEERRENPSPVFAGRLASFDALHPPDSAPAIASIRVDDANRLWVERWTSPYPEGDVDYDILDPRGRWLGRVAIPDSLGAVLEIGEDYLLTEWKDELEVPYLRMYGIVTGGG